MSLADIGLIGLGVMGQSLVLNIADKGFRVSCYNRTAAKVDRFINERATGKQIAGFHELKDFVASLAKPRKVLLMIAAGPAVDKVTETLLPFLEAGDIIIDGGNSHFADTNRRCRQLKDKGILFVGLGVSGGEEGALKGPSLMPGGNSEAWPHLQKILQHISAKLVDDSPCCEWLGPDGAGHFVKMVHNGIEYGDMQLICEAFQLLHAGSGLSYGQIKEVFADWNKGELGSYLIEITADILDKIDPETGKPMLDIILDTAGQKGTGSWTSQTALELGAPAPQIAEAVFARSLSAIKDERVKAAAILHGPVENIKTEPTIFIENLQQAVYAAKICSYAQGFQLLRQADLQHSWNLNYADIARIWRGGCIIRADFLKKISDAFAGHPDLENLMLSPFFAATLNLKAQSAWRNVIKTAIEIGIPTPSMSSALNYFDSYRAARLPANLLQAQRDYFGAHTFERTDKPRGQFFHHDWL
jgi:6-phosphogluconate dehydrogenase